MVAVRALLATLNGFAQTGTLARGRARQSAADRGHAGEPWDGGAWAHAGDEPPLEELLHDPVVRLVMQADRLEPAQVRRLLELQAMADRALEPARHPSIIDRPAGRAGGSANGGPAWRPPVDIYPEFGLVL